MDLRALTRPSSSTPTGAPASVRRSGGGLPPAGWAFLDRLCDLHLLDATDLVSFFEGRAERLPSFDGEDALGSALAQAGFLTRFQLERVRRGCTHGLVVGNYRVLDEIGKGGMGVVYRAEHRLMKRRVALKVVPVDDDCPAAVRQRFYGEMRVLAELVHPNVVLALDAGEVPPGHAGEPGLIYLVTELLDGGDLEKHVANRGPCGVGEAVGLIRQAALGLQAAHDRHLVHRDLKPSNLLLTSTGRVKLVDFGLVRQFVSRLTDPRSLLGSVEFMPPEQSHDPSAVGKEADVYGLGATLFWLLTGEAPYPYHAHVGAALRALQAEAPRRARDLRPEVPEALDELIAQMLHRNPGQRPASALAVCSALAPFDAEPPAPPVAPSSKWKALVVDDEARVRGLHRALLEPIGCSCVEARDGATALEVAQREGPFDLVLLDLRLPDVDGYEVCRRLRERDDGWEMKVIIVSGTGDQNDLSDALPKGADDYVVKPFAPRQLLAKVRHALELKDAERRARVLADQLRQSNWQLQTSLEARAADVREAHNALLFAMAKMAESRDGETPGHLKRMQEYCRVLARQAALAPPWAGLVDERFLQQLARCVPLHDIGKIGLPDEVLLKPGALGPGERALVEAHPAIGDRILEALGREHGTALDFLGLARAIVRHHHERHDGTGYPDRLAGEAIPPAARLVAVADVYDALRRRRPHKPALAHTTAVRVMLERSEGQFDPSLVQALTFCHSQFERIYRETAD